MQKRTVIGSMEIEVLDADALARLERARPPPPTFSMRLAHTDRLEGAPQGVRPGDRRPGEDRPDRQVLR